MTIETKYNIGDEVWFMDKNKPIKGIAIKLDRYSEDRRLVY